MEQVVLFISDSLQSQEIQTLILRFCVNIVFILTLILGIYYRVNKNPEYIFNLIIFNILIFFVSSLLSRITLETGFAFGLFAIFSILRYRTEAIPIKEMTFMFISIIMATINSTVTADLNFLEILFANIIIISATFIMEKIWLKKYKQSKQIIFEKIDLIHEDRREELIDELEKRTGLKISDVKIQKIDFLHDTAKIKTYLE